MKAKTEWGQKYRHNGSGAKYVVTSFFLPHAIGGDVIYYMLANLDGGYYSTVTPDIEQIFGDDRDQFSLIVKA